MRLFHYSAIYVRAYVPEMRLFSLCSMIQKKKSNKPHLSGNQSPHFLMLQKKYIRNK